MNYIFISYDWSIKSLIFSQVCPSGNDPGRPLSSTAFLLVTFVPLKPESCWSSREATKEFFWLCHLSFLKMGSQQLGLLGDWFSTFSFNISPPLALTFRSICWHFSAVTIFLGLAEFWPFCSHGHFWQTAHRWSMKKGKNHIWYS